MEIWRARFLEKHLRTVLSPSTISRLSQSKSRSYHTLPYYPLSSRRLLSICSSFSSTLSRHTRYFRHVRNPSLRVFSSLSPGREVEWTDERPHQNQPHKNQVEVLGEVSGSEEDDTYHLLEAQQEKQSRFIPVKAYFLCTRFLSLLDQFIYHLWIKLIAERRLVHSPFWNYFIHLIYST